MGPQFNMLVAVIRKITEVNITGQNKEWNGFARCKVYAWSRVVNDAGFTIDWLLKGIPTYCFKQCGGVK